MSDKMLGGWSSWNLTIDGDAEQVFKKALAGFTGVDYTPLAVATQVISGKNYCFLCQGKVVVPEVPELVALVYIYQPLKGEPHITDITRVNP